MKEMKKMAYTMIGGMVVGLTSAYFAMPKNIRQEIKDAVMNMASKKKSCNCPTNNHSH